MIYHVLPGDAVAGEFHTLGIEGEAIICRECLVVGPVDADTPFEFWDQRARFILAAYAEDEIEFHERVADELERVRDLDETAEVNLWFEYELFCSVNMWFCLSLLAGSGATVYRIEPVVLSAADRWSGFGKLGGKDLEKCFDARIRLSPDDIALGADLWEAYRKGDSTRLSELSKTVSVAFPYLSEVCEAAIEKETRPEEILSEIRFEGMTEFAEIFPEFSRRAGVYGFGDLQVQSLLDQID